MATEPPAQRPPVRSRLGYVPALDGVRAIAALRVLSFHYFSQFAIDSPFPGFQWGRLGSLVFFTLSGFVITALLIEEFHRSGTLDLWSFWKRRLLRLVPALVFVLAVLMVLGTLVDAGIYPSGQGLREIPDSGTTTTWIPFWPGLAVVFLPISNWVWSLQDAVFIPLAVVWMPAVQDQIYLVWPFLVFMLLVRWRLSLRTCLWVTVGLALLFLAWRTALVGMHADFGPAMLSTEFNALTLRTDFNLAGVLIGCAGGLAYAAGMLPTAPLFQQVLGAAAWGSLAGILAIFAWGVQTRPDEFVTLIGIMTVILVMHLVTDRTSRLSALLSWPPLVGIGQVSYGIYLWHWVWLQYPLGAERGMGFQLLIAVILTVISVLVSYYLIELPALRLKARIAPRREAGPAAESSAARLSRRNLLPVLGMGTIAVIAVVSFGMMSRMYPQQEVSSVAALPPPPRSPRSPRAPRKRRVSRNLRDAKRAPRRPERPQTGARSSQAPGTPAGGP